MKKFLECNSNYLKTVIQVISTAGGNARLVGGCVRDAILDKRVSDIDIATDLLPEQVLKIFRKENIKVVPTGIEHGTVTVVIESELFEITTLREDIETDGRHAKVKYTKDFRIDASRRDFTINSLSYDLNEETIYDYYGGIEDLKNRKVRFIGNAEDRIKEDYLRILRFFRFSAYYADEFDAESLAACKKHSKGLENISRERVNIEISKILECNRNLSEFFKLFQDNFILKYIHLGNEIDTTGICNFEEKFEKYFKFSDDVMNLRLAFLLFGLGIQKAGEFLKENKFSNKDSKTVIKIISFIEKIIDTDDIKLIFFEVCKIWYYKKYLLKNILLTILILSKIDEESFYSNLEFMSGDAPKAPFSSEDVIQSGYQGLALGNRIRFLEKKWIESGFTLSKEELINFKERLDVGSKDKKIK